MQESIVQQGGAMTVNKSLFLILMIATLLSGACAKEGTDSLDKRDIENNRRHNGTETAEAGLVAFIKKQKLVKFQSDTIGNAFDSYRYLMKKEWKETALKSRHITVDFTGWLELSALNDSDRKEGITGRGLEVKFVIEPNGSYYVFMISKIESRSDGKVSRYQQDDIAGILSRIYANKEIRL